MPLNRICIFVFALSLAACGVQEDKASLETVIDETKLREGDLVFRLGRGTSSRIVNRADRERSYSHIGLLVKDSLGEWYVIHAVPGEGEETEGKEVVKCDPLLQFFGRDRTVSGVVMRFDSIENVVHHVVRKTKEFYHKELPFDHRYTLSDTTTLYCTELIHRVFLSTGIDLTEGRRHTIPMFKEDIIFPSDILKNQALWEVFRVDYR